MRSICVVTEPDNPWIADVIEDHGYTLIVRGEDGVERGVSITDVEWLDGHEAPCGIPEKSEKSEKSEDSA